MNRKYGRRENIRKQQAILEETRKNRVARKYAIIISVIGNGLFLYFFSWLFFEKKYGLELIPVAVCLLNAIIFHKKILLGLIHYSKLFIVSALYFFACCFLFAFTADQIKNYKLKNYGKEISGIIIDRKWQTRARGNGGRWAVKAEFKVENKIYHTLFVDDSDEIYEIGDSARLVYSTQNPEISKLIQLQE